MATIKDTIQLVPDEELQRWIHDFFVNSYGEASLKQDVEGWYASLGGRITQHPFSVVSYGKALSVTARPIFIVDGGFIGSSRYVVCLYGLISLLSKKST